MHSRKSPLTVLVGKVRSKHAHLHTLTVLIGKVEPEHAKKSPLMGMTKLQTRTLSCLDNARIETPVSRGGPIPGREGASHPSQASQGPGQRAEQEQCQAHDD